MKQPKSANKGWRMVGVVRHGMHGSPEYRSYTGAKQRCCNPKNPAYHRYGGRGIEFRFGSFAEFFAALGERPSDGHSVERVNNDGHYESGNVVWADDATQYRNMRSNSYFELDGVRKTLTEWAHTIGINPCSLYERIHKRGWDLRKALTTPKRIRKVA